MLKVKDTKQLNDYLSAQVRAQRTRLGMTLRELDLALVWSPGTVARLERGDKRLDSQTLFKLATYLNTSVDSFFAEAPEIDARPDRLTRSDIRAEDVSEFISACQTIPNRSARREILALMRTVAESACYRPPGPSTSPFES